MSAEEEKGNSMYPSFSNFDKRMAIFLGIFNFLLIVLIPLAYFQLIPSIIQARLDGVGSDAPVVLQNFNLKEFSAESLALNVNLGLDPVLFLPVKAGLGHTNVKVVDQDGNTICETFVPVTEFWVNYPLNINVDTAVSFNKAQQENMKNLLGKIASGIPNLELVLHLQAPILVYGFTFYSSLALTKRLDVGEIKTSLITFGSAMNRIASAFAPQSFAKSGAALRSRFEVDDLLSLSESLKAVWSNLTVQVNDEGFDVGLGLAVENGSPFGITRIPQVELLVQLEDIPLCKVVCQEIKLVKGIQDFKINARIEFVNDQLNGEGLSSGLEKISKTFASTGDFQISLKGPVEISSSPFIAEITKEFKFTISLQDLIKYGFGFERFKNYLTIDSLSNSNLALLVDQTGFRIPVGLKLANIPGIPHFFNFPYTTTLDIMGSSTNLLSIILNPINVDRSMKTIGIDTALQIIPVNTPQAATELAAAVNPILALNPSSGLLSISNLGFINPANNVTYKWTSQVFGGKKVDLTLPAIDKENFLDGLSNSPSMGLSKIFGVSSIDATEVSNGFKVDGQIKVNYDPGLPSIKIDLAYIGVDLTVESQSLLRGELDNLQFSPEKVDLGVTAGIDIYEMTNDLRRKTQHVTDEILGSSTQSFIGVTGFDFGASRGSKFLTFSKIAVDVHTIAIKRLVGNVKIDLPNDLLTLNSADLVVAQNSQVMIKVESLLNNPTPVSATVGPVGLSLEIDNQNLANVKVGLSKIDRNSAPLNLDITAELQPASNLMAQKIASFIQDVQDANERSSTLISITGISIGSLTQFSFLKFSIPTGTLVDDYWRLTKTQTVNNFSKFIPPTDDLVSKVGPHIEYLQFAALQNSGLGLGVDIAYHNIIPVSAKIPYAAVELVVDQTPIFNIQIQGIEIDRNMGTFKPRVVMSVYGGDAATNAIGNLIGDVGNGDLHTKIKVSKIYFGASLNDRSDILSDSTLEVDYLVKPIVKTLSEMINNSGLKLHKRSDPVLSVKLFKDTLGVVLNSVGVNFDGENVISTKLDASLSLPFPVDINIPYFSANLNVDGSKFVQLGFGISTSGNSPHIITEFKVNLVNSDEVGEKIAGITDAVINGGAISGSIGIDNILVGLTATDRIEAFSRVALDIPASELTSTLHNELDVILKGDFHTLLGNIGLSMNGIKLNALPGKSVHVEANAGFKNSLQISITGLGYISLDLGIDDDHLMTVTLPNGLSIQPGSNSLHVSANAQFRSSLQLQQKVGEFGDHLQNALGKTRENIVISELTFGVSERFPITLLKKSFIKLASSYLLNDNSVKFFKGIIFPTTPTVNDVDLNSVAITFVDSSKTIDLNLGGSLNANFPLSILLPFVKLKTLVDEADAFDVTVFGIDLAQAGPLMLKTEVKVDDTDELADKIKAVADAIIRNSTASGTLSVENLVFGVSEDDYIDAFSLVKVAISAKEILTPIVGRSSNAASLTDKVSISLRSIDVLALPAQSIQASLKGSAENGLNLTLKGLGYFGISLGLDNTDVLIVDGGFMDIQQGSNAIDLKTKVRFPSSADAKSKVAFYANELYTLGANQTSTNITAQSLIFGNRKENSFKFLSKALISLKSSSIITPGFFDSILSKLGFDSAVTEALTLQKAHLNGATEDSTLLIDLGATAEKLKMDFNVDIGFASLDIGVNDVHFLKSKVLSGVSVKTENSKASLAVGSKVEFSRDGSILKSVSEIVLALYNSKPIPGTMYASGLFFGASATDMVDSFSEIKLSNSVANVYKAFGAENVTAPSIYDLSFKDIDLDVVNQNTLVSNWNLKLANFTRDIYVNLPFLHFSTLLNDAEFMDLWFTRFSLKDGIISGGCLVHFPDDPIVNNLLVSRVSDILFHRVVDYPDTVAFNSLEFGPSKKGAITILSQVSISIGISKYAHEAGNYFDTKHPLELEDIQAKLVQGGVDVVCHTSKLAFPINILLNHLEIDINWQVNGTGKMYRGLGIKMDRIILPVFHAFATPDLNPDTGALEPLEDLVVTMFSFKQFSGNARFGALKLIGSNGAVFMPFFHCNFDAPPTLYIPIPAYVDLFPYQDPLEVALSVTNPSPLHLDMGRAEIRVIDSSGSELVYVNSTRDIIALNKNEGGNSTIPPQLAYFTAILNLGNLAWDLPGIVLKMLRRRSLDFQVEVHIRRDGVDIDWIQVVTQYLITHGIADRLLPLLGTIMANVKITVAPPPEFRFRHKWFNMNGSVVSDIHSRLPLRQHFPDIAASIDSQPQMKGLIISGH